MIYEARKATFTQTQMVKARARMEAAERNARLVALAVEIAIFGVIILVEACR